MLYVVVLVAAVFYVALFSFWHAFRPQLEQTALAVASWRDIIYTVPDSSVLILLKEVLILSIVYLVVDALVSVVRRSRRRAQTTHTSWKTHKLPDYSEPL